MNKVKALLSSRRWWVAVAAGIVAAGDHLGLPMNPDTVQWLVLLAGSWIVGDSLRETT